MQSTSVAHSRSGFTLVELLVISPLLVIIVAVMVGLFVSITGDSLISRERNLMIYSNQNALNEIEDDIRLSTAITHQTGTLLLGQGSNSNYSGTTGFTSNSDVLVVELNATDTSPLDPNRRLLYYANSPNACSGPELNDTVRYYAVYFLDNTNLTKRTIVSFTQAVCGVSNVNATGIFQRNSCKTTNNTTCFTRDTILASDISDIDFKYFLTRTTQTPTAPSSSTKFTSVEVTIVSSKQVAGSNATHTSSLRAARIN